MNHDLHRPDANFDSFLASLDETQSMLETRRAAHTLATRLEVPSFKQGHSISIAPNEQELRIGDDPGRVEVIGAASFDAHSIDDAPSGLREHALQTLATPQNSIAALHHARHARLVAIPIDASSTEITIRIEQGAGAILLAIAAETSSAAHISIEHRGAGGALHLHLAAHEHSHVRIDHLQHLKSTKAHWSETHLHADTDASIECCALHLGGSYLRTAIEGEAGRGASIESLLLFCAGASQRCDLITRGTCSAPRSQVRLHTRGIVAGCAHALSRGLIRITPDASCSSGFERQEALIIGEHARADAIPDLAIANHEVRCSHATAIGSIDEAQLFYLRSRGLDEIQARRALMHGYLTPLLPKGANEQMKEAIESAIGGIA